MLEEIARVVKVESDTVWVVGEGNSACSGCVQKAGCSTTALASVLKRKPIAVDSTLSVHVGDTVIVAIEENTLLRAAFSLYLPPLFALFLGALLAQSLIPENTAYPELWLTIGALTGLGLALLLLKQQARFFLANKTARPVIIKKC